MKTFICCLTILASFIVFAHGLTFQDCGSKIGKFTNIDIKGCDTTKRACILRRGTNASIGITFESRSTIGNFSKVDVSGCDIEKQACILKKGTNASIFTTFETTKPVEKVEAKVWGRLGELEVPFALPNPDGCTSGVSCPVKPNQENHYKATLPVLKSYPKVSVMVKWVLADENDETIICVLIPAQIK